MPTHVSVKYYRKVWTCSLTHSLSWVCKSSTVHLPSIVHWKNYLLSSNQESVEIRVFLIEQCIEDFNYHIITHYVNFPLKELILF